MERQTSYVVTGISLHELLKALTELSTDYPCDRLSPIQIEQIERAAQVLRERLQEYHDQKRNSL